MLEEQPCQQARNGYDGGENLKLQKETLEINAGAAAAEMF
jgi:hypothetical protein